MQDEITVSLFKRPDRDDILAEHLTAEEMKTLLACRDGKITNATIQSAAIGVVSNLVMLWRNCRFPGLPTSDSLVTVEHVEKAGELAERMDARMTFVNSVAMALAKAKWDAIAIEICTRMVQLRRALAVNIAVRGTHADGTKMRVFDAGDVTALALALERVDAEPFRTLADRLHAHLLVYPVSAIDAGKLFADTEGMLLSAPEAAKKLNYPAKGGGARVRREIKKKILKATPVGKKFRFDPGTRWLK